MGRGIDRPGGPVSRAGALEQLVTRFLPLVRGVARRYAGSGEPFDDLVQAGAVGLVAAVRRFDPRRGDLAPFVHAHVEGEIRRHLRDRSATIRVPRAVQQAEAAARAPGAQLDATLLERAARARSARSPLPLSETDAPDADGHEAALARVLIERAARALTPRERRIVLLHHFAGLSQDAVARELGISQVQVSRLFRGALAKLRTQLDEAA